jgi:small-conductance mechanosensitive channel/CRP-like cAMP-binding protein
MDAILALAREGHAAVIAVVVLVLAGLLRARRPEETRRVRWALLLLAGQLALIPIAVWFDAAGLESHQAIRFASELLGALALISICATALFAALPVVGLDSPHILREILVAASSLVAFFAFASRAGFNLSGLIATSTVLTAIVGLSFQDTLGNVMAGLALQFDRSIQQGDWLKVGDLVGRVSEIRWRTTSLETRNWETVLVPNSVLVKSQFIVLGRRIGQPLQWRRWVYFNVDYRFSPSRVTQVVMDALRAGPIEGVAAEPPPDCVLMDLGESYGRYAVRYWLTDLARDDPTDGRVRTRIYFVLRRAGIPLSLPAHAVFLTEESQQRKVLKGDEETARRLRALAQVDFFEHLEDEDRQFMAERLSPAPFAAGEAMTRQGMEAHWLYLLLEGEADVQVTSEGGSRTVARLRPGDFFGEMSLMTGAPRSATVVAVSETLCYRLDKAAFQELVRRRPQVAERVAEVLAGRRYRLGEALENMDEEARRRHVEGAAHDLLGRMKHFFGLD